MKNLMISLKRFFGNKNTITIICVLGGVLLLYFAYNYRINQVTRPVTVPYAKVEIQPREKITLDKIGFVEFPSIMVKDNVVTNSDQIIDMYANYNTVIPAGSLFYKSTLVTWAQMPDSAWANIPDGYTVVSLNVNTETTYGNSIFPGNYIDLYYATYDETGKLLLGRLIESIEVLAVKDSSGAHVFENSSELKSPASLIFAVPEPMHLLLRKAGYVSGEIIPVPRNKDYSENPLPTTVDEEYIQDFIESKSVCLPGQCVQNSGVGTID
jgi:uncharacterized membrane protein YobD (UPF0266 family)